MLFPVSIGSTVSHHVLFTNDLSIPAFAAPKRRVCHSCSTTKVCRWHTDQTAALDRLMVTVYSSAPDVDRFGRCFDSGMREWEWDRTYQDCVVRTVWDNMKFENLRELVAYEHQLVQTQPAVATATTAALMASWASWCERKVGLGLGYSRRTGSNGVGRVPVAYLRRLAALEVALGRVVAGTVAVRAPSRLSGAKRPARCSTPQTTTPSSSSSSPQSRRRPTPPRHVHATCRTSVGSPSTERAPRILVKLLLGSARACPDRAPTAPREKMCGGARTAA